ncbi:MAG: gluconokinase [Marinoscillum sp.]|uniref:gluconokinase n=1 Tax=Marinoscillum sp. TaxID=2024838 RepID=UPI0032FABFD0
MAHPIIIMGVSGSGKTTIGNMVADRLGKTFLDADDFHPEENKAKMADGIPLNDDDRLPWLQTLKEQLISTPGVVLACSALKASYRFILDPNQAYFWIYLDGSKELIFERLKKRTGHYMKENLLDSQFETLEVPAGALKISIDQSPDEILSAILKAVKR